MQWITEKFKSLKWNLNINFWDTFPQNTPKTLLGVDNACWQQATQFLHWGGMIVITL